MHCPENAAFPEWIFQCAWLPSGKPLQAASTFQNICCHAVVAPRPLRHRLSPPDNVSSNIHSFIIVYYPLCIYPYLVMMFEENSRQNCFTSPMLPSLLASKVEGNQHVLHMERSTACLLATLSHRSLQNNTLSKVFKHAKQNGTKNMQWCAKYSSNAPLWWQGWLWAHAILWDQFVEICFSLTGSSRKDSMISIASNLGLQVR